MVHDLYRVPVPLNVYLVPPDVCTENSYKSTNLVLLFSLILRNDLLRLDSEFL